MVAWGTWSVVNGIWSHPTGFRGRETTSPSPDLNLVAQSLSSLLRPCSVDTLELERTGRSLECLKGGSLGGGTERDSWESEDGLPLPLDIQDPRAEASLLGVFKAMEGVGHRVFQLSEYLPLM